MDQPLGLLVAFLALAAVLFGLFSSVAALFPRNVWLAQRAAEESPGRSLLLGAVNTAFVLAVSLPALASQVPVLTVLGVIVLAAGASGLAIGLSGVATMVGRRLSPRASGLAGILTGTVVLALASATPFLGWFVFLPAIICLGMGAFVLGWFRRRVWSEQL
jgi:hypothetical protein